MPLFYRTLADAVVILHLAYVMFIILGLAFVLLGWALGWNWTRNPMFRIVHLIAIAVVVVEAWLRITCPLTVWEQQLRALAGQATYRGAFLARAAHELLFVEVSPAILTVAYSAFGAIVLLTLIAVPPVFKTSKRHGRVGDRDR